MKKRMLPKVKQKRITKKNKGIYKKKRRKAKQ